MDNKICAVALVVAFIAGWMVNGWRLSLHHTEEKLVQTELREEKFKQDTQVVHEKAVEYVDSSKELEAQINDLKKELADAKKRKPLPVECRPDDERMRFIRQAVRASNKTAAGQ